MKINLTLVVSKNCSACERAKNELLQIQNRNPSMLYDIVNINSFKKKNIVITPALLINGKLFSYGDIDKEKIELMLN